MAVISLKTRTRRPEPDAVAVCRDFDRWSLAFYQGGRFRYRRYRDTETEARDEAEHLVREAGLSWHVGGQS